MGKAPPYLVLIDGYPRIAFFNGGKVDTIGEKGTVMPTDIMEQTAAHVKNVFAVHERLSAAV